jgi:hypothetical protein
VKITAKGERADGTKIDTVTTVKYDDKQVSVTGTGLTWDMTAIEQVNGKTLTEERWKTGGKYHTWVQTVVSKNGGTMTSTSKGTDAVGKSLIGIGAAVTRRPLPHHRAYGSVHGGSSRLRRHFFEQ